MKLKLTKENVFELLFGALILSLPWSNFFTSVFTFLPFVVLLATVSIRIIAKNIGKNWVMYAWLAFILWQSLSFLYADNLTQTLSDFRLKLPLFLLTAMLCAFPKISYKTKERLKLYYVCTTTLAAFVAIGIAVYKTYTTGLWVSYFPESTEIESWNFYYIGLASAIMHPGYFALFVGVAAFVTFDLGFSDEKNRKMNPLLSISLLSFLLIFLLLLGGRINLLAFGIIAGIGLIISLYRQKQYLSLGALFGIPTIVIIVFIFIAPKDLFRRFFEPINTNFNVNSTDHNDFTGLTIRLAEWNSAWKLINAKPILGESTGDAKEELLKQYQRDGFIIGFQNEYNCHNQYIETALQSGYPGMILLILAFLISIYSAWRTNNYVALNVIIYIMICLLTESMLQRQKGVALLSIILPLLLLNTHPKTE